MLAQRALRRKDAQADAHGMRWLYSCLGVALIVLSVAACSQVSHEGQAGAAAAPSAVYRTDSPGAASVATVGVTVVSGGSVSADGAVLDVPAGIVASDGTASISRTDDGEYDLAISVPWTGQVTATIPLSDANDLVIHKVDGNWIVESSDFGESTVQVSHLSPFTSLSNLAKKAVCLKTLSLKKIASCLIGKGVKYVSAEFAQQLAGVADDPCFQHLINASVGSVALSMFTGPCVGHAGEPDYTNAAPPPTADSKKAGSQANPSSPLVPQSNSVQQPIFTVMNTSEVPPDGVWFRNGPHTSDTDKVTGLGVYVNERVQLRCYGWGDVVGKYQDRLWYRVVNVSRPSNAGRENSGWLNAHYINDGKNANVVDSGVSEC